MTTHTLRAGPLAAAMALGAAGAAAQAPGSGVTIYGVFDIGVEQVSNVAAGGSLTRVPTNTNTAPPRLGLRGTEDLGGGLSAIYTIEMGIDLGAGTLNQGGRAWGRQSLVGLSGPFGTISLGRQYAMTFWAGLDADIHGGGIYGTGSLDSYLPNARTDNSIVWRGRFDGLSLGVAYSLGRDVVNAGPSPAGTNCPGESATDSRACRAWSAMVKYDTPTWGAALAHDRQNGRNVGAAPDAIFGGLNTSDKSDTRLTLNGWAKLGETKVGGGVIRRANDGNPARRNSDLWHIGASHPVLPLLTLSAQYVTLRYRDAADADSGLLSVRATYNLSKRTALFAQIGQISNDANVAVSVSGGAPGSNPAAGGSQTGFNAGIRHTF
ncbi:MAG: porin [Rubrivivax sp.]|nr:porin [Rubrivivax sp.]